MELPNGENTKWRRTFLLSEALKFLGLFVRGSKVPDRRDITGVIAEAIHHYRRVWMTAELEDLARQAEESGLDEEDRERAHQLEQALGILSPEGSNNDRASPDARGGVTGDV
ncbi:hypothetical protein J2X68_008013 [Streptomyces sp. 3330]|uniref:hypothetical protein n=1 Tax=Streptomyces sp. 3330 TaxID=2817755 RepID=UPI00285D9C1D|nr:hypothetical protein [Streptomyces sp. 3330]MDR6981270.1 hypothetical protein [Streptomyces sp. 3330]